MAGALLNLPAKRGPSTETQGGVEPERKLLEAVLEDAIQCWQACAVVARVWRVSGYSSMGKRQREYFEADFWFFGEYDNAPLFSFQKICDCLGLDPDFIRRRLREWRASQTQILDRSADAPLVRTSQTPLLATRQEALR
jgi:hypothetical protein